MKYTKSEKYDKKLINETIMGPNPVKLLEEILASHEIPENATVLDLGCGCGITSVFMVKEYNLRVFATDLWISATENFNRFKKLELSSKEVIPIHAEAHSLPFAEEFFDVVVCIDAYQYFGCDEEYLGEHLLPLVKHGGYLLIAVPGFKKEFNDNLPKEFLLSWKAEDLETFHDLIFWQNNIEKTEGIELVSIYEMEGCEECWNDWLATDHEYAISDRASMNAGAGKHMNFIAMIIKRK
jgi:cyclopropane fatty-acyl-phospholipid synthase-like methyltransferase